jgi:hypothetical protein
MGMETKPIYFISKKQVKQTGEFIMEYGRDLERALYQYHFGREPSSSVVTVLESYCNADGGVGGLELDIAYEGSLPINCTKFLALMHHLKVQHTTVYIENVLYYLEKNIDKYGSFRNTIPEVNTAPRAIWWNWDESSINGYSFNPTCEVIGYFYHFGWGDFRNYAKDMLDYLYDKLMTVDIGTLDMYDLMSLMKMCRVLPDLLAERFTDILEQHLRATLICDRNMWGEYCFSPLMLFKSPLDPLYYEFEKEVSQSIDFEINSMTEDGVWLPKNWHWWQFNEEFVSRQGQIVANVSLNKLILFKNFKRITTMG